MAEDDDRKKPTFTPTKPLVRITPEKGPGAPEGGRIGGMPPQGVPGLPGTLRGRSDAGGGGGGGGGFGGGGATGGFPSSDPYSGPTTSGGGSIAQGLMARGFSRDQALAIAGNIGAESNYRTNVEDYLGLNHWGLMQWGGARLRGLRNYAKAKGKDWRDVDIQLDYVRLEYTGGSVEYGGSNESSAYRRALDSGGDAAQMTLDFARFVERPSEKELRKSRESRLRYMRGAADEIGQLQALRSAASAYVAASGATLYQTVDGNLHQTEAGMDPELRARLLAMKAASPYGGANLMGPRSGYRTYAEQVAIANEAKRKHGANWRKWAAMPGRSRHGFGQAADITYNSWEERKWYHQHARFYGINFPMGHEPWHAQLNPNYKGEKFYSPTPPEETASRSKNASAGLGAEASATIRYKGKPHSLILPTQATRWKRKTSMAFPTDQHNSRNSMRRVTVYEIDDTGTQQTIWAKGLYDEEVKMAYRAQGHGLSTVPPVGSEGYAFSLAGRPDQMFFLESEHKDHRPTDQKPGDSVLYDAYGNTIKMESDGVTHNNSKHTFNGDVVINGNVQINGDLNQDGSGKIGAGDVDN